jgi:AGCS family alanine or glycine:cation symporter
MATRYAESLLAIRYRTRDAQGNIIGGPMYVIERGMKCKWLAIIFAAVTAIAAFGIGNLTQANAVSQVLASSSLQIPTWVTGAAVVILVGSVLLGGLQGISRVCTALVPTMAIVYIIGCVAILISNSAYIWPAICHIIDSAFHPQAAAGGFIGSTLMLALQQGVRRGLFSNEAGLGSSPIVSAPAQTPNTVQHALVASTGPFWDTVFICTMTGITLTTCIMAHDHITTNDGELLTYVSFATLGGFGSTMLTISLASFVISTILGWSYFGERSLEYLGGSRLIYPYRILWVVVAFLGCVVPKSSIVWNFADFANGLMALPNLICMVALSGVLVAETRKYLWQNRLYEVDPTIQTDTDPKKSEKN